MLSTVRKVFLYGVLVLMIGACGEKNPFEVLDNAKIQVRDETQILQPNQTLTIGNVEVGAESIGTVLTFQNIGTSDLAIFSFALTSQPEGALRVEVVDGTITPTQEAPWVIAPQGTAGASTSRSIRIMLKRSNAQDVISGSLVVRSNSSLNAATELVFPIEVVDIRPILSISPDTLEFGNVVKGETKTLSMTLLNTGTAPLTITGFRMIAPTDVYTLEGAGSSWKASDETIQGVTLEEPLVVGKGQNASMTVHFSPQTPDPMPGEIYILSNDPDGGEDGHLVVLRGNMTGACFTLNPKVVDMGGYPLDKTKSVNVIVNSCGTKPLEISRIELSQDPIFATSFAVDASALPGLQPGMTEPSAEFPVVMEPGTAGTLTIQYIPEKVQGLNPDGTPILDVSEVEFTTNTFVPERELPVSGHGIEIVCPTAVPQVEEGELVIPQTQLNLHGESSYAGFGEIVKYEWSVEQPEGSTSSFLPNNTIPNPSFQANVAGFYVFTLRVWDDSGNESCVPGQITVEVKPDEVIHVELLWHNEADENEADDQGADLDLHFLHEFALVGKPDFDKDGKPDGWFDAIHDCYWYNRDPNWDIKTTDDDDPGLDLDDKSGAGPENTNLRVPPDGVTYYVGVHYWKASDFGSATATVRVYLKGELVYEVEQGGLVEGDLWDVCSITFGDAQDGTVTPTENAEGGAKVVPNYPTPPQLPTD